MNQFFLLLSLYAVVGVLIVACGYAYKLVRDWRRERCRPKQLSFEQNVTVTTRPAESTKHAITR
jgi:hypothetical protein